MSTVELELIFPMDLLIPERKILAADRQVDSDGID